MYTIGSLGDGLKKRDNDSSRRNLSFAIKSISIAKVTKVQKSDTGWGVGVTETLLLDNKY
jgi:hypothetical protein